MKFDYCVSNPPYQESGHTEEDTNNTASNIFHHFYLFGVFTAEVTCMIFPGGRWMQRQSKSGFIADSILPTLREVWWFPNGEERHSHRVFENVNITDGVSVVVGRGGAPSAMISVNGVVVPRVVDGGVLPLGAAAVRLHASLEGCLGFGYVTVHRRRCSVGLFDLPSRFVELHGEDVVDFSSGVGVGDEFVKAWLANDSRGASKRVKCYWLRRSAVVWSSERVVALNSWLVVTSQAALGKRPERAVYKLLPPGEIMGSSWVCVGMFGTEVEAVNYAAFLGSPLVRALLAASKGGNTKTWGVFVPDLGDYTGSNRVFMGDDVLPVGDVFCGLSLQERLLLLWGVSSVLWGEVLGEVSL